MRRVSESSPPLPNQLPLKHSSDHHLQILNAKTLYFWMAIFTVYLHCLSRILPYDHYTKDFQRKIISWSIVFSFVTLKPWHRFSRNTSWCLQTSKHIVLSNGIQKYFQMIDPGFPFYRQEMALAISQQVPVLTGGPGSFLPCTGCKETHRSPFGYLKQ